MSQARNRIAPYLSAWMTALLVVAAADPSLAAEIKIASIAPDGSEWMREMRAGMHA